MYTHPHFFLRRDKYARDNRGAENTVHAVLYICFSGGKIVVFLIGVTQQKKKHLSF